MSKKQKARTIKVIIENPECIPIAQERLIKFLYDEYIRETSKENYKKLLNK